MLHDQVKFGLCFNDFIKLNNVRMSDYLQNVNFSCDALYVIDIFNFGFFEDFHSDLNFIRTAHASYLLISMNVYALFDLAESSLT